MTPQQILERYEELTEGAGLKMTGYDEAVIGIGEAWVCGEGGGSERAAVLIYDYQKILKMLTDDEGMDEEEAEEYISFNMMGAYIGPYTPIFANAYHEMSAQ
jgi:hypothetical protein